MDAHEWDGGADLLSLLSALSTSGDDRKLRLFGCACCRRIWEWLPCDLNRQAVLAIEDYPEGKTAEGVTLNVFTHPVLDPAITNSSTVEGEYGPNPGYWAVKYLGRSYYKLTPWQCIVITAQRAAERARGELVDNEEAAQIDVLRCIFGNPFRPLAFANAIITPTVVSLAQAAADERLTDGTLDADRLAILADALEEAGCTDEPALLHCRGLARCARCEGTGEATYDHGYYPPPKGTCPDCRGLGQRKIVGHYRGCHVVDGILRRE